MKRTVLCILVLGMIFSACQLKAGIVIEHYSDRKSWYEIRQMDKGFVVEARWREYYPASKAWAQTWSSFTGRVATIEEARTKTKELVKRSEYRSFSSAAETFKHHGRTSAEKEAHR